MSIETCVLASGSGAGMVALFVWCAAFLLQRMKGTARWTLAATTTLFGRFVTLIANNTASTAALPPSYRLAFETSKPVSWQIIV